jgi:hypothetical protein
MQTELFLTRHAAERRARRSIREHDLDLLMSQADQERRVRGGALKVSLTDDCIGDLLAAGVDPNKVRRAARIVAVVGSDGAVITLYRRKPKRVDARNRPRISFKQWGR